MKKWYKKITQNNWNTWTVNLIMRAIKLLTSRQIFRYAVPARTDTKKALRLYISGLLNLLTTICMLWTSIT